MVVACFELSPLIFLLDKLELSGELKTIHGRLLNGTPRKRRFWGNMGRIPNTGHWQRRDGIKSGVFPPSSVARSGERAVEDDTVRSGVQD